MFVLRKWKGGTLVILLTEDLVVDSVKSLTRAMCKCQKDDMVGWVTIIDNKGTVFARPKDEVVW